jgi:serine/threonine-protein kinase
MLQSMQIEARAASSINHPNVLAIYDFGVIDDGLPYIVMDFVDGGNLDTILKRDGCLPPARFRHLFNQLCDALHAVHERSIVHRDLKPANFLIARTSEELKLTGFNVCKRNHEKPRSLTLQGELVGTPSYMSPEQCMGLPVDNRSDIYSLGCCMYESLTGSPPFTGNTIIDTMMMHVSAQSPALLDLKPEIAHVQAVLSRCLEKKAEDRFQSMQEVQRALVGVPVKTKPSAMLRGLGDNNK